MRRTHLSITPVHRRREVLHGKVEKRRDYGRRERGIYGTHQQEIASVVGKFCAV